MDASEARTANIRALVQQAGGPAEFARLYGGARWSPAQVSQWTSATNPKGIGGRLARDIEEAIGKPRGWLDSLRKSLAPTDTPSHLHTPFTGSQLERPDPEMLVRAEEWALIFQTAEGVKYDARRRMEIVSKVYGMLAANGGRLSDSDHAAYLRQVEELIGRRTGEGNDRGTDASNRGG